MSKRTTSVTAAHARSFNHYIRLREGSDLTKWLMWLKGEFGDNKPVAEEMRHQRWAVIGGNVGFRKPEDAQRFMVAANDDLANGVRT